MSARELTPCPFCGSDVIPNTTDRNHCEHPNHEWCPLGDGLFLPETWNRRASLEPVAMPPEAQRYLLYTPVGSSQRIMSPTDIGNWVIAADYDALRVWAARGELSGWQPIETAPKGKKLIVCYKNSLGNWRTVTARYYAPETLESEDSESGYADEGWYEESDSHETILLCNENPTHWQHLPRPPALGESKP